MTKDKLYISQWCLCNKYEYFAIYLVMRTLGQFECIIKML